MTKPTQAQIEDCIAEWANDEGISFDATTRLSNKLAALTATKRDPLDEIQERYQKSAEAQFTAATEAGYGEPQGTGFQAGEAEPAAAEQKRWPKEFWDEFLRLRKQKEVNATIERCAQWLKERDRSPHVHFLADKMCSALKEE